ncbi:PREDICTED: uncharacterized protein LOC105567839 [Vollenhovia emeryi]|uniref:uncharacterized protein LOC105567839 n=1 Tax=Vollenhovia emeryi TaxID=411798 RepID=UPI0005F41BBB|nr:PREDICTED: uncharacterized protein LOC105567839 [Vollenhovia emeryi]
MIKIFEYISNVIPFYGMSFLNTHNSTSFIVMQALKELLDNSFEILRSVPENVFIKCLKEEISRWACTLHYGPCLIMARKKLLLHFEDPSSNIISPGWKEWTYCQGLLEANISERIISKEMWLTGELLPYLPCTRNPSVVLTYFLSLQKYSQHAKRETSRIRRNINIFHLFIAKHANNSILTKNLMFITKIMPK